ncbi:hypothetical protein CRE_24598 [Caenorhabditis remanei]|uniref:PAN-3 domain-containing protein n=1 Tax=Caenorhabditis remanei TaxID=31234 RepID=E3MVD9_CAERE|nr:hypothetical protein CRE_24598 [Caenorhabditis remanei]
MLSYTLLTAFAIYANVNCIMISVYMENNVCQKFEGGDLQTVKRSNNVLTKFAYKLSNVAACPKDDNVDGKFWQATPYPNQTRAVNSCGMDNGYLTGLETMEEFDFLIESAKQIGRFRALKPMATSWISGVRKPECIGNATCQGLSAFALADPMLSANPTGYVFNKNKPDLTSEDCLVFRINSDSTYGIENFPCDFTQAADNSTILGGQATVYCPMIVTNGVPEVYSTPNSLALNWDQCLTNCSGTVSCMAVYSNAEGNCQLFDVGQLQTVKRSIQSNSKFAFKIKDENLSTCPVDDRVEGKGSYIGYNATRSQRFYKGYTVNFDPASLSWIFNSTESLYCSDKTYQFFMRPLGPWCMKIVISTDCRISSDIADTCGMIPGGMLSGIESQLEIQYIEQRTGGWDVYKNPYNAIWISGIRKTECIGNTSCQGASAFSFSDPTLSSNLPGYQFKPNKPDGTGADCLAYSIEGDISRGIENFQCNLALTPDNSTCMIAHLCGMIVYTAMIVTSGTPSAFTGSSSLDLGWEDCLNYCTENATCVAIHEEDTVCRMFEIGQLQTVGRSVSVESKFAYKINNDDLLSCPADDTIGGKGYFFGIDTSTGLSTSGRQIYENYTITYDSSTQTWNFLTNGPLMCPSAGHQMFLRPLGPWCMIVCLGRELMRFKMLSFQFYPNSPCQDNAKIVSICASSVNKYLSGIESPEEFEWHERTELIGSTLLLDSMLLGFPALVKLNVLGIQVVQAFSFGDPLLSENPTGYIFKPGKPNGSVADCLAFRVFSDRSYAIDNILCTATNTTDVCMGGEVCGIWPS